MRSLVTGGAGFIGSHLACALLERGDDVTVIDDLSTGRRENLANVEAHARFRLVVGSCADAGIMAELVASCDRVFHLASVVGVRRVMASPVHTLSSNIASTETVLALASEGRKPVLLTSTSEVYGPSAPMPLREDANLGLGSPAQGRWSYACSKAANEFLAMAYGRERHLPVVTVRLFNTVGPRQTGRYGMVIPTFVRQGLDGSDITVFGDGQQSRCFVHVADVVLALLALLQGEAHAGQIYNVGSDHPITIWELAQRIRDLTGGRSRVVRVPYPQAFGPQFDEPVQRVPDIAKLTHAIGWRPRFALHRILADVLHHARQARPQGQDRHARGFAL